MITKALALDIVADALSGITNPIPATAEGAAMPVDKAFRDLAKHNPDAVNGMYDYMKFRLDKEGYFIGFLPSELAFPKNFKTVGDLAVLLRTTAVKK